MILRRILADPLARRADIDSPLSTLRTRQLIADKPVLRRVYNDWYARLIASLPAIEGPVLEVGSGAGFLDQLIPGLITSDVTPLPGNRLTLDAHRLPMADASLRAIIMTNVLHHLPEPADFLAQSWRCIKPGGVLTMIEPWVSSWSAVLYRWFHHEPFDPRAGAWRFAPAGRLSGANQAMPWIIFQRDRQRFEKEFPGWALDVLQPIMPLSYLMSGGVSLRTLLPSPAMRYVRWGERNMPAWLMSRVAMFAHIRLVRRAHAQGSPATTTVVKQIPSPSGRGF